MVTYHSPRSVPPLAGNSGSGGAFNGFGGAFGFPYGLAALTHATPSLTYQLAQGEPSFVPGNGRGPGEGYGSIDPGGDPYGASAPTGSGATETSARTMGQLLGGVAGLPSSALTAFFTWYGNHHPDAHGTTTTAALGPSNGNPAYRSVGTFADYGGYGPSYFGPSRGTDLASWGSHVGNDFATSGANMWDILNPGQNLGGARNGRGAGGGASYNGTASPWDWGAHTGNAR